MKIHKFKIMSRYQRFLVKTLATVFLSSCCLLAEAQDGNAGINAATSQVRGYFSTGTQLLYAIGAILGLIGAVKVYKKLLESDHDAGKVAASWFGACIFLVVVSTVLKSFFGV